MIRKKGMGLRSKAIALSLILSFLPLILMSYVSYISIDTQYSKMATGLGDFHEDFQNMTRENITALVDSYMYDLGVSYATPIESRIQRCAELIDIQADYIEYMIERNISLSGVESYTQDSPPSDRFYSDFYGQNISLDSSVYHLAPHTDPYNTSSPPVTPSLAARDINLTALMDPLWISMYNRVGVPLLWFYISTESGVHRSYPWHSGYASDYDARTRDWYLNSTANVSFSDVYYGVSGGGLQVSINRAIYVNGEKYGVVAMDVPVSSLSLVTPSPSTLPVRETFIIDEKGHLISHPSLVPFLESLMEEKNLTWEDEIPAVNIAELEPTSDAFNRTLENITAGGCGQEYCPCPDGGLYITYIPINGTDWMLVITVDAEQVHAMEDAFMSAVDSFGNYTDSQIERSRTGLLLTIFPFAVFIGIVAVSLSLVFADSIVYPIISLKNEVDKVSMDLDHPVEVEGSSEVADLARSFELMRLQLKADMDELREQNRISASLNAHLTRLQNDITEKSERIRHLYYEALRAGEAREAMLHMLAHELRTPLTTIHGNQQILERQLLKDGADEKLKERLAAMRKATERLTSLVNDSLLLLSLEKKGYDITMETFPVEEWVDEAVEKVPSIKEQSQTVRKKLRARTVKGDRLLLTRALRELLENASHYSPPGSEIEVIAEIENGGLHLVVRDHGPGIPRSEWKSIFQPFYARKEFREHEPGRRAMGLAIVRLIVERHDGSIWVESGKDGTAMHIWLVQSYSDEEREEIP